MKSKLFVLPISLICLTSCIPTTKNSSIIKTSSTFNSEVNHEYSEINKYRITWNEIFDVQLNDYFVYFFQRTCSHCESIKNKIIEEAFKRENIFFYEDSGETVLAKDVSYTIGLTSVENFTIQGFPSLIEIVDGILVKNIAGDKEISRILFV